MPKSTVVVGRSKDLTEQEIAKLERLADVNSVLFLDHSDPQREEAVERLRAAGISVETF